MHPEAPLKDRIARWRLLMKQFILLEWCDCADALQSVTWLVACGMNLKGLCENDTFLRATSGGRFVRISTGCRRQYGPQQGVYQLFESLCRDRA